jgi:hypothetical protein
MTIGLQEILENLEVQYIRVWIREQKIRKIVLTIEMTRG